MPVQPEVLGFSNWWYPYAMHTAERVGLGEGVEIRVVSAVAVAFARLLASPDFLNVLPGLIAEPERSVASAPCLARRLLHPNGGNTFPPASTGFAWISITAIVQASVPRLIQLCTVPRCTMTSPA